MKNFFSLGLGFLDKNKEMGAKAEKKGSERGSEREAKGDTFQKLPRGVSNLLEAFGRCPLSLPFRFLSLSFFHHHLLILIVLFSQ